MSNMALSFDQGYLLFKQGRLQDYATDLREFSTLLGVQGK